MSKELRFSDGTEWQHLAEIVKVPVGILVAAGVIWLFGRTFLGEGENIFLAYVVEGVGRQPTSVWVALPVIGWAIGLMVRSVARRDRNAA